MTWLRYDDKQLLQKFNAAKREYQRSWQHIDDMMRSVVQRHPSNSAYADVHTKVALVDGLYRAQINRAISGRADGTVANALRSDANVRATLRVAARQATLTAANLPVFLEAHKAIITATRPVIAPNSRVQSLRSFASKYVHFHAAAAPIFDSYASGSISRFVDMEPIRSAFVAIERGLPTDRTWDDEYQQYVVRFLALSQRLASLGVTATVKYIDHMLWSG